jgi:hypothetical protein
MEVSCGDFENQEMIERKSANKRWDRRSLRRVMEGDKL